MKKEGLAARVVDRQQVLRSMSREEISDLFDFDDDENIDKLPGLVENSGRMADTSCRKSEDSLKLNSSDCPTSCSSDKLMGKLLDRHRLRYSTIKLLSVFLRYLGTVFSYYLKKCVSLLWGLAFVSTFHQFSTFSHTATKHQP